MRRLARRLVVSVYLFGVRRVEPGIWMRTEGGGLEGQGCMKSGAGRRRSTGGARHMDLGGCARVGSGADARGPEEVWPEGCEAGWAPCPVLLPRVVPWCPLVRRAAANGAELVVSVLSFGARVNALYISYPMRALHHRGSSLEGICSCCQRADTSLGKSAYGIALRDQSEVCETSLT